MTLDAPAPVPEWQEPGDSRSSISLDQLLRMSSGLRFDEDMSRPLADLMRMLLDAGDAAALAIRQDLVAAPGTRWEYSSGSSNIVARVIRHTLQDDSEYLAFPRRALFDHLGMARAVIETDAAGTFVASSYMYATARDWARFGMLYLRDSLGRRADPSGGLGGVFSVSGARRSNETLRCPFLVGGPERVRLPATGGLPRGRP